VEAVQECDIAVVVQVVYTLDGSRVSNSRFFNYDAPLIASVLPNGVVPTHGGATCVDCCAFFWACAERHQFPACF
jgi:hypothetical protein